MPHTDNALSAAAVSQQAADAEERLLSWMEAKGHLPPFLRDFHSQKDLFKMLDALRQHRAQQNPGTGLEQVSFIAAHNYTIDVFLWRMAEHGYTLQRSRQRYAFADIRKTVADYLGRVRQQSAIMMRTLFASSGNGPAAAPEPKID